MNKSDLIENLKQEAQLTKNAATTVVELIFDAMSEALGKGDRIELRGFCSFHVKAYDSYIGRNPKTGEQTNVLHKKLPFFKPGKELKDRVDQ